VGVVAYAVVVVLGLLIGSFLNVVIWRVPRAESVVSPPSACPACGHPIRARDNVPVLSWLLLRGRCRDCAAPISPRYPVVEAATAALFALVLLRFGWTWSLPAYLFLAAVAIALALIDLDFHRLPSSIVLPAYPVLAGLLLLATWNPGGPSDWGLLIPALIGCAALFGFYFALAVIRPGGMGMGDVRLAGLLGLALGWLGWGPLVFGAFAAFVLGGVYSLALLATRRASRKSGIPFGPWMLLGAAVGIGCGEVAWDAYLSVII
jgi:leader peptidase (prepilin peptidase)/N-methyltransferase